MIHESIWRGGGVRLKRTWALLVVVKAVVSAAAPVAGDEVSITKPVPLYFREAKFREAVLGEKFKVIASSQDRAFLLAKDKQGKEIALSVQLDAVTILPADSSKITAAALAAAKARKFIEAANLIKQAVRADPQNTELHKLLDLISAAEASVQQVERAKRAERQVSVEAARMRKNAGVIDRPNPLNRNDSSNQQRAEAMRKEADRSEEKSRESVAAAEAELKSKLAVLTERPKNLDVPTDASASDQLIPSVPGVDLTPSQEAHNRGVKEQQSVQREEQFKKAAEAIKKWTEDIAIVPQVVVGRNFDPNYEETLSFINGKLEQSGRRLWFGEHAGKMILKCPSCVIVFDPALCNPEVYYGQNREQREHARYPMGGYGLPPVLDTYTVERSKIRIGATNGRKEIQFFYLDGVNEQSSTLYLNWDDSLDQEDLKKLSNALSHLIRMFGGKSDPF